MAFVRPVHASVVLNEFSSNSDPEWVELYNTTADPVNIMGWKLSDEVNTTASLSGVIDGNDYFVYERSGGWLNNSGGATITLKDAADV
ncbi:MAG: lamin tail domain-containing protein, partial [Patescibacteria group bacterium]